MNAFINKKTFLYMLSGCLILTVIFSACKKTYSTPADISGLAVIQASPNYQLYDFYIGTTKANQSDFTYNNKLNYLNVYSGARQFNLTKKNDATVVLSGPVTLKPQMAYSMFLVNKVENLEYLLLEDNLTPPPAGKAIIRFVNTSWNAPELDLVIEGSTNYTFTDRAFKEFSNFEPVSAETVNLKLKNTTTSDVVANFQNVTLEKGKIYTIYARGIYGALSTDPLPLSIAFFEHK